MFKRNPTNGIIIDVNKLTISQIFQVLISKTMKNLLSISLKTFSILVLLIIIASCEKNDEDQFLKDQIVGTWKSTNSYYKSYTFNENNTFIDTAYYLYSDNPFDYKVLEIISGDYLIKDGQLTFSNIRLVYYNGQESGYALGYSTTYDQLYNISFDNDILILNQKDVFEPINKSNSGIIGKWNHNKLVAVCDNNLENKYTGGSLYGIYDFKSDLSVNWQYETKYDNITKTGSASTNYDLSNSQLTINQWGLYNLNVSFTKTKMIWLYSDRTFQRKE
jgi:hypothetical protein